MNKLKIAISGTHGVGKSTLVNHIGETYGLNIIGEKASLLMHLEYPFQKLELDFQTFLNFEQEVISQQMLSELDYKNLGFVADRPLIDSLAYTHVRYIIEKEDSDKFYDYTEDSVLRWMNSDHYDLIFFIRYFPEASKVNSEIRNLNSLYQKEIDKFLFNYYQSSNSCRVVEIDSSVFEERSKLVDLYLN